MSISVPPKGDTDRRVGAYFAPIKVSAQDAADMTVKASAGSFWTYDGDHVEYVGGSSATMTATGAGLAKWSVITLNGSGLLQVLDGTESASPVLPTVPAGQLALAAIFIKETTTEITTDMVFDIRPLFVTQADVVEDLAAELADRPTTSDVNSLLLAKADVGGTPETVFLLNQDLTGLGASDAFVTVERGSELNVSIRWNETDDQWELTNDGTTYGAIATSAGAAAWGAITGTLSNQTDLQAELDAKSDTSHTHLEVDVTDLDKYTVADVDALIGGKADTSHTHTASDVTDFSTAADARIVLASVDDLADMVSSGPADEHVLIYNNGAGYYENRFLVLNDLTNLNVSGLYSSGDVLIYDGANFIDRALVKADVSDFTESDYVHTTGTETIGGDKTFSGAVDVDNGTTSLLVGPSVGVGLQDAGLQVVRSGSPAADALLFWEESTQQWVVGVVGSASAVLDATDLSAGLAVKANLVGGATAGNFAGLDGSGDLTDSGSKAADFEPADATILKDADIGVTVQAYDATYLVDADIGVNVQAYDATILNTSNSIGDLADVDVAGSPTLTTGDVLEYDGTSWRPNATILKDADIGVTVQAYDATYLVDADIGVNVQAYDATTVLNADVTYALLDTNGDVGNGAGQLAIGDHLHTGVYEPAFVKNTAFNENYGTVTGTVAAGDHLHTGVYEPADATILKTSNSVGDLSDVDIAGSPTLTTGDVLEYNGTSWRPNATILKDADIGVSVQAYDATTVLDADVTYALLDTNGDVGTGAGQLAIGNHTHTGVYEPADATILKTSNSVGDLSDVDIVGSPTLTTGDGLIYNGTNFRPEPVAPVESPTFTGVPVLPTYTVGTLPAVVAGGIIFVSDGGVGSPAGALAFSDGESWIDSATNGRIL